MPAVAWVTVVIAALIIAAAALGLIRVILHLRAVDQTLDTRDRRRRRRRRARPRPCPPSVCRRSTPASSRSATSARRCERARDRCCGERLDHRLGDRLHHRHRRGAGRRRARRADPAAGALDRQARPSTINDSLQQSVHNTAALTELEHDDRPRRGHRRRAAPRPHQAGRLTMDRSMLDGTDVDPAQPVVGRRSSAASSSCSRSPRCSRSWCCWCAPSTSGSSSCATRCRRPQPTPPTPR